jgi:glycosyltransferase involved in cell wall biosynthesis
VRSVALPQTNSEPDVRPRGLAIVASRHDYAAAWAKLPHDNIDWTVLALFGNGAGHRKVDHVATPGASDLVISGNLTDRGWQSRYRDVRGAIALCLRDAEARGGPFAHFATHAFADCDDHPAIWHVANVTADQCRGRPVISLALRAAEAGGTAGGDQVEAARALLHRPIHGQIVQRPRAGSVGVVVSPFWTIPWELRNVVRRGLMERAHPDDWYVIMADTTFRNLPPSYILPLANARFSVDPAEHAYFRDRCPDLGLLEFCQSQLTPSDIYAPDPGVEKVYDFVYSARICGVKRHIMLVDALARLKAAGHRFRTLFLFYPKDNEDTRATTELVRARVRDAELDVTFHTTGERGNNEAEVAAMLNRCKVGVFMSEEEGPAFAIPEYLLCDLPVVAYAGLRGGGLHFLNADNSRLFEGEEDLPHVLFEVLAARSALRPRGSALAQAIGEGPGNRRFAACLAEQGVVLRDDAEPLRRHLGQFSLDELCR